jgi:hypothetical protein
MNAAGQLRARVRHDDEPDLVGPLPWPHHFDQSLARWRWLRANGHQTRLVTMQRDDRLVGAALFEREGRCWHLWKGPSGEVDPALLDAALAAVHDLAPLSLVLARGWDWPPPLEAGGFVGCGHFATLLVPTDRDDARMLRAMKDAARRRIGRALRGGLQVACDLALLPSFYPVYRDAMVATRSPDFATFDELESLLALDDVYLFVALSGDEVAAGAVCYRSADCLEARYVATNPRYRHLGPLNLVHFRAMQHAARQGVPFFDLSGLACEPLSAKSQAINRFKLGFGGSVIEFAIYRRDRRADEATIAEG